MKKLTKKDEEKITVEELKELIEQIENGQNKEAMTEFLIYQGKAAMPTSSQSMWPKTLYIQKVAVSRRLREGLH